MSTTKTKAKKPSKTTAKQKVPSAKRDAPSKADRMKDRFKKKAKGPTKTTATKDRPVLKISKESQEALAEWVPAKDLADYFKTHLDECREPLLDGLWDSYLDKMWQTKSQPQNPALEAEKDGKKDVKAQFQIQARYKINMPSVPDDEEPEDVFVQTLVSEGLKQAKAKELVENELHFEPKININISALLYGALVEKKYVKATPEEETAISKVLDYLDDEDEDATLDLTLDERAVLDEAIVTGFQVDVEGGFLERACSYAESRDQLKAIFQLITPTKVLTKSEFAVSDNADTRTARLKVVATDILEATLGD